ADRISRQLDLPAILLPCAEQTAQPVSYWSGPHKPVSRGPPGRACPPTRSHKRNRWALAGQEGSRPPWRSFAKLRIIAELEEQMVTGPIDIWSQQGFGM